MEVNKSTWKELRPKILQDIKNSEFVALDTELTGLHFKSLRIHLECLDLDKYYESHKISCEHFVITQIGLSCFIQDKIENKWICKPYNIYISPSNGDDKEFLFNCSADALKFLTLHNFDFNKWIKEGVHHQAYFYWKHGADRRMKEKADFEKLITNKMTLAEMLKKLEMKQSEEILSDKLDEEQKKEFNNMLIAIEELKKPEKKEIEIKQNNSFLRAALFQKIHKNFAEYYADSYIKDETSFIKIYKFANVEEFTKFYLDKLNQKIDENHEKLGITELFVQIFDQKKVIVGHNCFFWFVTFLSNIYWRFTRYKGSNEKANVEIFLYDFRYKIHHSYK